MSEAQPNTGKRALALRCEAASRADRELDLHIKAAVYGGYAKVSPFNGEWCLYRDVESSNTVERPHKVPHAIWSNDRYTASIDAALTLVPDGYDWAVFRSNGGLTTHAWCGDKTDVFGETPALALCAAALKARAHGQGGDGR